MKRKVFIILLIGVVLISIGLANLGYSFFMIKSTRFLEMDLEVGKYIGFNIDPDAIHFGVIPPGNYGKAKAVVNNVYGHTIQIEVFLLGELAKWVTVSDDLFILARRENKTIAFQVDVPTSAKYGNYRGRIKIIYKRVL